MKSIIAVIQKSNFIETNYDEILQGQFKEFAHKSIPYMRITTFEKYAMQNTFEQVFYTEDEFEAWLVEVPISISKLQAISRLLQIGRYDDLMSALDLDPTGANRILFEAAHQLGRNSSMVNEVGAALQMNSDDIDTFFIEASNILI